MSSVLGRLPASTLILSGKRPPECELALLLIDVADPTL
jgi:hypothetical protein